MRVLALAVLLLSFESIACPNLAGYFSICRSTTGSTSGARELTVRQRLQNGVTLYQLSGIDEASQERQDQSLVADGRTYVSTQVDSSGQTLVIRTWAICRQNTLLVNQHITGLPLNLPVSQLTTSMSKSGPQLVVSITGQSRARPITDRVECD